MLHWQCQLPSQSLFDSLLHSVTFSITAQGTEISNGIWLSFPGRLSTLLITKTSVQIQQTGTTQTVESYRTDYRNVNAVSVPYSLDVKVAGQPVFTMQVQKAELNPAVDDNIFKMLSASTAALKQ
jgi:hypothetical protein